MARRRNGRKARRLLRKLELPEPQRREIRALLLLSASILLVYALYASEPGWLGRAVRAGVRLALGSAAPVLPLLTGLWSVAALLGKERSLTPARLLGGALAAVLAAAFADGLAAADDGGVVGRGVNLALVRALGETGRAIVLYAALAIASVLVTGASLTEALRRLGRTLAARRPAAPRATRREPAPAAPAAPPAAEPAPEPAPVAAEEGASPEPASGEPEVVAPPAGGEDAVPGPSPEGGGRERSDPTGGPAALSQLPLATDALYQLPPLSLLSRRPGGGEAGRRRDAEGKRRLLEQTFRSFGVEARVIDVKQGPAVTRFEVQPGPGVKVARIVSLADDIALNLAAPGVRIVAPIPGKAALGIEVPNTEVATVYLRDVLETREFQQSPSRLTVAIGQDIGGRPVVSSLERMVHLLVAGATGSGKSVFINSLLASLLFKASPRELRLLLIDPKVVELSAYNGIPHLLTPVITDPRRAAGSLKWLLKEMERRYEAFAEAGVRDITRYNEEAVTASRQPLPFIVVVIDELADLMMVAPAEVEDAIQRLAQMARAAGIHLVVATQRPSVEVITGVIKANIASRIAFAVSSQADSRTILDMGGAEKLLGKGDMLFHPMGAPKPLRVQGAYLPEGDLEELLAFVRRQGQPAYREEVLAEVPEGGEGREAEDDLFPEAVRVVLETGQASVSILQRRLRVGYSRAGRLIDMMEQRGIVGPHQGSKPREILISAADYRRLFGGGG